MLGQMVHFTVAQSLWGLGTCVALLFLLQCLRIMKRMNSDYGLFCQIVVAVFLAYFYAALKR